MTKTDRFAPLLDAAHKGVNSVSTVANAAVLKVEQAVHSFSNLFGPSPSALPMMASSPPARRSDDARDDDETDDEAASRAGAAANWQSYFDSQDAALSPDGQGAQPSTAAPEDSGAPETQQPGAPRPQGSRPLHPRSPHAARHQIDLSSLPFGQAGAGNALNLYAGSDPRARQNCKAFLDMIAVSEGTILHGSNGYNVKVGGSLRQGNEFNADVINLGHGLYSSAYGRYQVMRYTYYGRDGHSGLRATLAREGFTDFSPAAQDAAALELIRQRGALDDVRAGRFREALAKCSKEWASLPGAGYGQHENQLAFLEQAYLHAGGQVLGGADVQLASARSPGRTNRTSLKTTVLASAVPEPSRHNLPSRTHAPHADA